MDSPQKQKTNFFFNTLEYIVVNVCNKNMINNWNCSLPNIGTFSSYLKFLPLTRDVNILYTQLIKVITGAFAMPYLKMKRQSSATIWNITLFRHCDVGQTPLALTSPSAKYRRKAITLGTKCSLTWSPYWSVYCWLVNSGICQYL